MEWFLRYGGDTSKNLGDITGSTNTFILIGDSDLVQDTDFWQGGWAYVTDSVGADNERMIVNSSSNGQIDLEWPLPTSDSEPTSAATYEIWDGWPPSHIHNTMNRAIRHAHRFWPDIVVSENVVHVTGKLRYDLTSDIIQPDRPGDSDGSLGTPVPSEILQVWLEVDRNSHRGDLTTFTSATVFSDSLNEWSTNEDGDVVDSDWLISVYDGAGAGELRQLNTWDTNGVFTVDTDWTATLDTTSRYRAWNPSSGNDDEWYRMFAVGFDQIESPNYYELKQLYPAAYGLRMRLVYIAQSTDMTVDTDVTRVPLEYVQYKAMSFLYAEMVGDNQHDRASNAGQTEYYGQLADDLVRKDTPTQPAGTLWQERDHGSYSGYNDDLNPLDW